MHYIDAEIISCEVPVSKDCALYIPKLIWDGNQEELRNELHKAFSKYGLVYSVIVFLSKFQEALGTYYAVVRYYSRKAAKSALINSANIKINNQKIKILMSKSDICVKDMKLFPYLAEELISYYFGFNAWTSEILYLEKDEFEDKDLKKVIKFSCLVCITTRDGSTSKGVGTADFIIDPNDAASRCKCFGFSRKFAVANAMTDAFSKFLIVLLPNGKRSLEVNNTKDDPLYLAPSLDSPEVKRIEDLQEEPIDEVDEDEWIENLSDSVLENLLDTEITEA